MSLLCIGILSQFLLLHYVEDFTVIDSMSGRYIVSICLLLSSLAIVYWFIVSTDKNQRAMQDDISSQLQIANAVFQIRDAVMVTDANGAILRVNKAFESLTGYSQSEIVGQNPSILSSGLHDKAFYKSMWAKLTLEGRWKGELWDKNKAGVIYPKRTTITAIQNESKITTHYVAIFTAISSKDQSEEEILRYAYYDPLTALPNRRLLLDRLKITLNSTKRSQRYSAILFLDLDNFKQANDRCGHQKGDEILVEVAKRIIGCIREVDTVSRLGGDEFVVLLENVGSNYNESCQNIAKVAESILHHLSQHYLDHSITNISTSIGVTLFNDADHTSEQLLEQADIAMYQAKASGRNTFKFFEQESELV